MASELKPGGTVVFCGEPSAYGDQIAAIFPIAWLFGRASTDTDFLELLALGVERHAVALEIDVDALGAIRRALTSRLATVAEGASALDA